LDDDPVGRDAFKLGEEGGEEVTARERGRRLDKM
jgi:hypothetical protein